VERVPTEFPLPTRAPGPFDRALARIEDALVIIAGVLVFILMFYGAADVISRAAFNRPLPSTYEYMELGMVAIVYLGVSQVQRLKGHVGVDFANKFFSLRANEALDLIGCLFGLVLMGAIGWWGAFSAWESYETGEYIGSVARVPVSPARIALLLGVAVLFTRLLVETSQHISRIFGRDRTVPE
jgi:TRAP-type C4-dicarboxylate transport system permease small subunit